MSERNPGGIIYGDPCSAACGQSINQQPLAGPAARTQSAALCQRYIPIYGIQPVIKSTIDGWASLHPVSERSREWVIRMHPAGRHSIHRWRMHLPAGSAIMAKGRLQPR